VSVHNTTQLSDMNDVKAADLWNESKSSYRGRSHGREEMNF